MSEGFESVYDMGGGTHGVLGYIFVIKTEHKAWLHRDMER